MSVLDSIDVVTDQSLVPGHGPVGARRFDYEPTYILRGLTELHLRFDTEGRQP